MKLTRINTSRLALSWTAETPTVRARHRHEGVVLLAADVGGISDEDVVSSETGCRLTVGFSTDSVDVPRKPAMAAWNQKALTDSGVDFLAIETVSLAYTLTGAQTAADLIAAIKQIGAETGGAGHPVPLDQMVLGVDDFGNSTLTISMSAQSASLDLAALHASLGDLPQTDELSEVDPQGVVAEPKRRRTLKPVAEVADEPASHESDESAGARVDIQPEVGEAAAVSAALVPALVLATVPTIDAPAESTDEAAEPTDEAAEPTQEVAEPAQEVAEPEVCVDSVPAAVTVAVPLAVEIIVNADEVLAEEIAIEEPAAQQTPATEVEVEVEVEVEPAVQPDARPLEVEVPVSPIDLPTEQTYVSEFGDDQVEPPEYDGPPEIDAPEPTSYDAPDMPAFDVDSLSEPPCEAPAKRAVAVARPGRKAPALVAAAAGPAVVPPGEWKPNLTLDGKILMTEADIF